MLLHRQVGSLVVVIGGLVGAGVIQHPAKSVVGAWVKALSGL